MHGLDQRSGEHRGSRELQRYRDLRQLDQRDRQHDPPGHAERLGAARRPRRDTGRGSDIDRRRRRSVHAVQPDLHAPEHGRDGHQLDRRESPGLDDAVRRVRDPGRRRGGPGHGLDQYGGQRAGRRGLHRHGDLHEHDQRDRDHDPRRHPDRDESGRPRGDAGRRAHVHGAGRRAVHAIESGLHDPEHGRIGHQLDGREYPGLDDIVRPVRDPGRRGDDHGHGLDQYGGQRADGRKLHRPGDIYEHDQRDR
ncbi:MAG: hypothetical protein MZV63_64570 [Marinilabiliales bacterium]|nr:hypothetical protein [Marinilabiliales bacterium]